MKKKYSPSGMLALGLPDDRLSGIFFHCKAKTKIFSNTVSINATDVCKGGTFVLYVRPGLAISFAHLRNVISSEKVIMIGVVLNSFQKFFLYQTSETIIKREVFSESYLSPSLV